MVSVLIQLRRLFPPVTRVRQFLWLASYYRRFVANFAKIAKPLFLWTTDCEKAFTELKHLLSSAPVLAYPVFGPGKTFIFHLGGC